MPSLLVISSAPATLIDGKTYLDRKFVEGMRCYAELFEGKVSCVLPLFDRPAPFGELYDLKDLPFDVTFRFKGQEIEKDLLEKHTVVMCSGDDHEYLHIAEICRELETRLFFNIEYIPETRRQIIFLDPSRSLSRKLYSWAWTMRQERLRKKAFRKAHGVQANGYPAFSHYKQLNPNVLMYLDNRVRARLLASEGEMQERERRLLSGAPVRLLHSGRLEHMKGSQDLIAVARQLVSRGVNFTLDIFGTGSLEEMIRADIVRHGLHERVKLHGVVDFENELVPFAKQNAGIYLSCHRQSDPSCSYIENMGCGLAVIGYANRMWSSLCLASKAGWAGPLGDREALASLIEKGAKNRQQLATFCRAARDFSGRHSFESEFEARVRHLRAAL